MTANPFHNALFDVLDVNGSGSLDLSELMHGITNLQQVLENKQMLGLIRQSRTLEQKVFNLRRSMAMLPDFQTQQINLVQAQIGHLESKLRSRLFKIECALGVNMPGDDEETGKQHAAKRALRVKLERMDMGTISDNNHNNNNKESEGDKAAGKNQRHSTTAQQGGAKRGAVKEVYHDPSKDNIAKHNR